MGQGINPYTGQSITTKRKRITTAFVRPSDTTQYAAGDVVGPTGGGGAMRSLAGAARANGGTGRIVEILLLTDLETITTATFRLHFFRKTHTTAADNSALTTIPANFADYLGYVDPPILLTQANNTVGAIRHTQDAGTATLMPFSFECDSADSGIYMVITAIGTYTPKSAGLIRVSLMIEQD